MIRDEREVADSTSLQSPTSFPRLKKINGALNIYREIDAPLLEEVEFLGVGTKGGLVYLPELCKVQNVFSASWFKNYSSLKLPKLKEVTEEIDINIPLEAPLLNYHRKSWWI